MLQWLVQGATLLLVVVYAPWQSFKAIKTEDKKDDEQWLTFWVIYSMFEVIEKVTDQILDWVPLYFHFKLCVVIYLVFFQGATHIFHLIEPMLTKHEKKLEDTVSALPATAREAAQKLSDSDYIKSAKKDATSATGTVADAVSSVDTKKTT